MSLRSSSSMRPSSVPAEISASMFSSCVGGSSAPLVLSVISTSDWKKASTATNGLASRELVKVGEKALAAETLDYRQYLADAMDDRFRGSATDRLVNDCLDAGEMDRVRGMVRSPSLTQLCSATLDRLVNSGL